MTDDIGTTTYSYEGSCPNVISENGPFADDTITYAYSEAKRLTNITFFGKDVSYEYDTLGRLVTTIGPEGTNAYTYAGNGRMVSQLDRANGTDALYQYDDLMRLTNLVNRFSDQTVLSSFAYALNDADQRIAVAREDTHHIDYGYDPIGQLLSAQGENPDSSPRPGEDFEFAYDPTGNPLHQNRNGFLLTNSFNELNQNATSLWGGAMSVIGAVNTIEADVTVNGSDAALLDDLTFVATNIAVSAGTNAFSAVITDPFGRKATNVSEVVVADHVYQYDANGNLTNDSRFAYSWNDENRLIEVRTAGSGSFVMECRYDGQGRRRERVTHADGIATTNRYVYHGWAVLAVRDGQDDLLETYTHGVDLSGSIGGAGGIGGILSMTQVSDLNPQPFFYHYDAQGNVINVTDEAEQPVATYTYSPFGIVLAKTGSFDSRYQFSTKEYDSTVGLNYYGYRYYSPQLGRWPSRDPLGEKGGMNLHGFVRNATTVAFDLYGLLGRVVVAPFLAQEPEHFPLQRRGWHYAANWYPPSGGDWDLPCECKPCTRVTWSQEFSALYQKVFPLPDENYPWQTDHGYGVIPWVCGSSGHANIQDSPSFGNITLLIYTRVTFRAKSYAICVEGEDAGQVYATVYWGYNWTPPDNTTGHGPVIF